MPFGLQIIGRFRADRTTLGVAHAMEQAFASMPALSRSKPDLDRLTPAEPGLRSIVTAPPEGVETDKAGTGTVSAV